MRIAANDRMPEKDGEAQYAMVNPTRSETTIRQLFTEMDKEIKEYLAQHKDKAIDALWEDTHNLQTVQAYLDCMGTTSVVGKLTVKNSFTQAIRDYINTLDMQAYIQEKQK